jgi:NAD(P)-dependent dehydrogenase (short-subunit alcohol dehydrogenase family)
MNRPFCLVIGAGAGIGGNVAKRFAREGYHACLARRCDKAGLDKLVAEIEAEVGPIGVALFNLGAQIGDRGQAKRLLTKSLEPLNAALTESDYMIGDLSGVDFMLGHASYMARRLGCMPEDMTPLNAYVKRLEARPAFDKGIKT